MKFASRAPSHIFIDPSNAQKRQLNHDVTYAIPTSHGGGDTAEVV